MVLCYKLKDLGAFSPPMGTAGACPALGPVVFSLLGTFLHAAKTNSRLFMGLLLPHTSPRNEEQLQLPRAAALGGCMHNALENLSIFTAVLQSKHFAVEEEGAAKSENKTHKLRFSALQPALTFICSPSLKHHYSHLPRGTGITSKLSGIHRNSFFFHPDHLKSFLMLWWECGFQLQSCCSSGANGTAMGSHRLGWCILRFGLELTVCFGSAHFSVIARNRA